MVDINIPWKPNWKPKGFDIFDIFDLVLHPEGPGTPGTGMVPSVQKKKYDSTYGESDDGTGDS